VVGQCGAHLAPGRLPGTRPDPDACRNADPVVAVALARPNARCRPALRLATRVGADQPVGRRLPGRDDQQQDVPGLGTGVIAIALSGCNGVTIDAVDFDTVAEGVFAYNSRNITIRNTRYSNIIGPHERNGSHRGNLVQFDTVTGFLVSGNKGKGGDTEDIVSLFKTNTGRVTGNQFEGTNWSSGSGTGIIAGDGGGGSGIEIDDNVLVNPGQVGIQLINGNANVHDNVIYAAPRTGTSPNVGISTYGGTVSGASVTNERVYWRKNDGSQNPFWWGAGTPPRPATTGATRPSTRPRSR
jgi:hypothetical protein